MLHSLRTLANHCGSMIRCLLRIIARASIRRIIRWLCVCVCERVYSGLSLSRYSAKHLKLNTRRWIYLYILYPRERELSVSSLISRLSLIYYFQSTWIIAPLLLFPCTLAPPLYIYMFSSFGYTLHQRLHQVHI